MANPSGESSAGNILLDFANSGSNSLSIDQTIFLLNPIAVYVVIS